MLNAVGGNVYALAGNAGGLVNATGTSNVDGHVWLTAGGSTVVAGSVNSSNAVNISGTGTAANPIGVTVAGSVNASGAITINGTGYAGASSQSAYGVEIANVVAGGGPITITGTGGNNGANGIAPTPNPLNPCVPGICNYGVFVNGGAVISTGAAPLTIAGIGGGAGGNTFGNDGVFNGGGL